MLKTAKGQNILLLLAGYVFYGLIEWRMLVLLLGMTIGVYLLGRSKVPVIWGVLFSLLPLVTLKYCTFLPGVGLIVPVGISFFTFKLISYLVDIHRGKIAPTDDPIVFALYVSFFPTILSGPIDRPDFMRQLAQPRHFDYYQSVVGCRMLLWGAFKKMVVADTCAVYVNQAWAQLPDASGSTLALAAFLYACQLYADFSGYSDMAIGLGRLLGLRVAPNFNVPFLAYNIADFWRRWHMSLTGWLNDYVFTPLSLRFREDGRRGVALAAVINMFLVGIWHGAAWTYVIFGLYHGLLLAVLILTGRSRVPREANRQSRWLHAIVTMCFCIIGWIIFRAPDMHSAMLYLSRMCSLSLFSVPALYGSLFSIEVIVFPLVMLVAEGLAARNAAHIAEYRLSHKWLRWTVYYLLVLAVWWAATKRPTDFIYFQF